MTDVYSDFELDMSTEEIKDTIIAVASDSPSMLRIMNNEKKAILEAFETKLVENQEDLDEEFARDVDEHFWDLF